MEWRGKLIKDPQTSALAEHALVYHHDITWNEAEVLDSNLRLNQRCALEAWHIRSQPHPMNRESGLLPQVYNLLIQPSVTSNLLFDLTFPQLISNGMRLIHNALVSRARLICSGDETKQTSKQAYTWMCTMQSR